MFALRTLFHGVSGPASRSFWRETPFGFGPRLLLNLILILAAVCCLDCSLFAAEIRGKVAGIRGEPLARVRVSILETGRQTITAADGSFVIPGINPGGYTLQATSVGYWLVNVRVSIAAGEQTKSYEVTLSPDNSRRTDSVEVKGDPFYGSDSPAIPEMNLTPEEVRETSTVLADDPFRSIQTMPGISAAGNDDLLAQFSVMGATYQSVGVYIDGILVPSPFHGVELTSEAGATLSIFTSDTLEQVTLMPAAYPEKYGDDVGAALALETRDGSRTATVFRISAGLADAEARGEGPLGRSRRGSWLASARKSYLDWLFLSRLSDTTDSVAFDDADLKLDYDITPSQRIDLYAVGGPTSYRLVHPSTPLTANDIDHVTDDFALGRIGWSWAVDPRLLVEAHGAYFEQPSTDSNVDLQPLENIHYAEWVGAGSVVASWRKNQTLEGGWMARRVGADSSLNIYNPPAAPEQSASGAEGWKNDGYIQQSSALFGNRLHLVGGVRVDTAALFDVHPLSPQLSAAWQLAPATSLELGYGRYHQFNFPAESVPLGDGCTDTIESLDAASHYTATFDQRFGSTTRLRLMLFDRNDKSFSANPLNGSCGSLSGTGGFRSFARDYSRGAEIVLESRNANRLSGWISYTLAYARADFLTSGPAPEPSPALSLSPYYPTLADQRNTLNLFGNYRLTPTLNLGAKFLFGSGFPVPDNQLNPVRLGNYRRLDLRAEKDWTFERSKIAAYAELLNATNHYNPVYFYTDNSGSVVTGQGLPIVPTAGIAFEF